MFFENIAYMETSMIQLRKRVSRHPIIFIISVALAAILIIDIQTHYLRKIINYINLDKNEAINKAIQFTGTESFVLYYVRCIGNGFSLTPSKPWGDMVLLTDLAKWDFKQSKDWMRNDYSNNCDVNHPHLAIVWRQNNQKKEAMWSFAIDNFTFDKTPLWLDINHSQKKKNILAGPKYFIGTLKKKQ